MRGDDRCLPFEGFATERTCRRFSQGNKDRAMRETSGSRCGAPFSGMPGRLFLLFRWKTPRVVSLSRMPVCPAISRREEPRTSLARRIYLRAFGMLPFRRHRQSHRLPLDDSYLSFLTDTFFAPAEVTSATSRLGTCRIIVLSRRYYRERMVRPPRRTAKLSRNLPAATRAPCGSPMRKIRIVSPSETSFNWSATIRVMEKVSGSSVPNVRITSGR